MTLRHAMLGLLANGPASGYDLLKTFDLSLANVWPATQSQVYTELGKLADSGLITVSAEGPRGRKEYTITDEGRAELRHWLTEVEPELPGRNGALLRVFFLDQVERREALGYLGGRAERAAEEHARLTALREALTGEGESGPLTTHGLLALEYGIRFTAMIEEWARWAADQLNQVEHVGDPADSPAQPPAPADSTPTAPSGIPM
ncbi:PadR family transcriptional regulator [Streptomyces sp. RB6PN25]|uniref:PadR family transcriptional regulator n=1 Tax=Streptomyces humicola TaxID=2953240 RepID=A0ABT1PN17_9ACTN|nr:PadR family transcriptional regulator [Streptomyces humicola]MCQ4079062.1 PadR family transcriptional regulator [Streptomyces humicola]